MTIHDSIGKLNNPLKWENLQNHHCPMCNSWLEENNWGNGYVCHREDICGFKISEEKLEDIIENFGAVKIQLSDIKNRY